MRLSEAWRDSHKVLAERNKALLERLKRILEMNEILNEENNRLWEANEKLAYHIRDLEEKHRVYRSKNCPVEPPFHREVK